MFVVTKVKNMITIEIDEQTYSFLQANAIPYVETKPGDTLKRLLGITNGFTPNKTVKLDFTNLASSPPIGNTNLSKIKGRTKKRKTNLPELLRAGMLQEGQKLIFQDYGGHQYPEYDVVLSGSSLVWGKQSYSMSDLAQTLLKKHGYNNDFVRGPIFWVTKEGKTIAELWDKYLKSHA